MAEKKQKQNTTQQPEGKHHKEQNKENTNIKQILQNIKDDETIMKGKQFIERNKLETLCAFLLVIGLILTSFYSHTGGAIVGLIGGYSLAHEFITLFKKLIYYYNNEKIFKIFIVGMLFLELLIYAPVFVISIVISVCTCYLVCPKCRCCTECKNENPTPDTEDKTEKTKEKTTKK